jgi:hypothetical protein
LSPTTCNSYLLTYTAWTYHSTPKNSKLDGMKMQQKKKVPDVILKFNKLVLPPVVAKKYVDNMHCAKN